MSPFSQSIADYLADVRARTLAHNWRDGLLSARFCPCLGMTFTPAS